MGAVLERLAALGIQILPAADIRTHYVFERDGFVSLVERTAEGFGAIGSPVLLTPEGLAAMVWRGGRPFFVSKQTEHPASPAQVDAFQRFSADLKQALA